jgi:hypothetical protein
MVTLEAAVYLGNELRSLRSIDPSFFVSGLTGNQMVLQAYYAFHWISHIKASVMVSETLQILARFACTPSSLIWIYLVLKLEQLPLEFVFWDLESLTETLESQQPFVDSQEDLDALVVSRDWCVLSHYILFEYGEALLKDPLLLPRLSVPSLAARKHLFPNVAWIRDEDRNLPCRILPDPFQVRNAVELPVYRQLHGNILKSAGGRHQRASTSEMLGLFHYHARLGAFVFADYYLLDKPQLCIQDVRSGKQLRPVTCERFSLIPGCESAVAHAYPWKQGPVLLDAALSPDELKVACVYGSKGAYYFFTCVGASTTHYFWPRDCYG